MERGEIDGYSSVFLSTLNATKRRLAARRRRSRPILYYGPEKRARACRRALRAGHRRQRRRQGAARRGLRAAGARPAAGDAARRAGRTARRACARRCADTFADQEFLAESDAARASAPDAPRNGEQLAGRDRAHLCARRRRVHRPAAEIEYGAAVSDRRNAKRLTELHELPAGRVALITGGGGEIGGAIARRFAAGGRCGRRRGYAQGRRRAGRRRDRRRPAGAPSRRNRRGGRGRCGARGATRTVEAFGKLTTLVNVAATVTPDGTVETLTLDDWNDTLAVNLTGAFLMCKYAVPEIRKAGGGTIINIASQLGQIGVARPRALLDQQGRADPVHQVPRGRSRQGRHPRQFAVAGRRRHRAHPAPLQEPRGGQPRARPGLSARPPGTRRRDRRRRAVPGQRRIVLHDRGRFAARRRLSCLQGLDPKPAQPETEPIVMPTALRLASVALAALPASWWRRRRRSPSPISTAARPSPIVVSTSTGGGYDAMARAIARHIGKHIPGNPTVVVRNMPGAGGITAVNWLYNAAEKDGTVLGLVQNGTPLEPLVRHQGGALRRHQVQLARHAELRGQHGAALAHGAGELARGPADQGDQHGRVRRQLDAGVLHAAAQRHARHQDEADQRLSGPERRLPGDGARRARRLSERVLLGADLDAAELAARQAGQGDRAIRAGAAEGTAATCRSRPTFSPTRTTSS